MRYHRTLCGAPSAWIQEPAWKERANALSLWATVAVLAGTVFVATSHAEGAVVKKSASGLCHCPGGHFYERTTDFSAFDTLADCIASGGREPKRGQGTCPTAPADDAAAPPAPASDSNDTGAEDGPSTAPPHG